MRSSSQLCQINTCEQHKNQLEPCLHVVFPSETADPMPACASHLYGRMVSASKMQIVPVKLPHDSMLVLLARSQSSCDELLCEPGNGKVEDIGTLWRIATLWEQISQLLVVRLE